MISQFETIPSISRLRSQSKWYDLLFDSNLGKFEWSEITDGRAIEKYPTRVIATEPIECKSDLKGELDKTHYPTRSRTRDIRRYKKIADALIHLAQLGQFSSFPARISAIK